MREKHVIREGAQPAIRRTYFHHKDLEEYEGGAGVWRIVSGARATGYIEASADLMRDPAGFADAMRVALAKWPNSCTNAFTTNGMNHKAWLGHAGCYLATGSPEETTRLGWHTLNEDEQREANAAADLVISEWRGHALASHSLQFDLFSILEGHDA